MSTDTAKGTLPEEIALTRMLMQKDGDPGEYVALDEAGDIWLVHDDTPGHWVVWVADDPVDVVNAHAYNNARSLADYLATYTNGPLHNPENHGKGFQ